MRLKTKRLSLLSGLLCLFLCPSLGPGASALTPNDAENFKWQIERIVERSPKYTWGGSSNETEGLDCSGMLYLAAKRCGWPVSRTTARGMFMGGANGWNGTIHYELRSSKPLDLIFFTSKTKSYRHDHIGLFFDRRGGRVRFAHASGSAGRTLIQYWDSSPKFQQWSDGFKTLTIGE